jgi:hypothetical protein
MQKKRLFANLRYCLGFYLEGLSKTTKNLRISDFRADIEPATTRVRIRCADHFPETFCEKCYYSYQHTKGIFHSCKSYVMFSHTRVWPPSVYSLRCRDLCRMYKGHFSTA